MATRLRRPDAAGLPCGLRRLTDGPWAKSLAESDWSHGGTLIVADDDGVMLGFANAQACRDEDADTSVGEVWAIYVAPEAYGKGYGRELMTATLDYLAQLAYAQVTLWVLDTNGRARRFYEAAGFRADGAVKVDGRPRVPPGPPSRALVVAPH